MRLWRFGSLGLRSRITLAFAVGGLILSMAMAAATLALVRQNLLDERQEVALAVVTGNGRAVRNQLGPETEAAALPAIIAPTHQSVTPTQWVTMAYGELAPGRSGRSLTSSSPSIAVMPNMPSSALSRKGRNSAGSMVGGA